MNEPMILCNVILRAWFVRHRHYLETNETFRSRFRFRLRLTIIRGHLRVGLQNSELVVLMQVYLRVIKTGIIWPKMTLSLVLEKNKNPLKL